MFLNRASLHAYTLVSAITSHWQFTLRQTCHTKLEQPHQAAVLPATTTAHSTGSRSNHHKQLHLNPEVTVPQLQNTRANTYGRIIAHTTHSWFTSLKSASECKTLFNPTAVTVFWSGIKQWKVCVSACACVQPQRTRNEFYDGVGIVLWRSYVTQNIR